MQTGRPVVDKKYSPATTGPDGERYERYLSEAALGTRTSSPPATIAEERFDHGPDQSRLHDV